MSITQTGKTRATVSWSKAKNSAYYRVYNASGSKYVRAAQTKSTKATLTVKRGKTLKVKVRGINGKKLGTLSSAKSLYIQADPAAPSVSASAEKDGSITASWKADKNADSYTLYISTDGKSFTKAGSTKGTSVTVKANDLDVKYVKVTAANEYSKASSSAVEVGKSSSNTGKTDGDKTKTDGNKSDGSQRKTSEYLIFSSASDVLLFNSNTFSHNLLQLLYSKGYKLYVRSLYNNTLLP